MAAIVVIAAIAPAYLAAHGELLWSALARRGFAAVCHQIPTRSFYLWGYPLAVCARCSGIYSGMLLGLVVYPVVRALARVDLPPRRYLIAALVPMGIDFLLDNNHLSRFITGAVAGAGLAFYLLPATISITLELTRKRRVREFVYGDTK